MPGLRVVVEEAGPEGSQAALAALLERTNFWDVLEARVAELAAAPETFRILIKPDAAGFDPSSPVITAPSLVEALIDLLFDRGYKNVGVATATDASGIWLENRSPEIVADLLGYRYETPRGVPYEVCDLDVDARTDVFAPGSALCGHPLAAAWRDAQFRIVFAKNKTCERNGYALCLQSLIDVLAAPDKAYQYRARLSSADAVVELLKACPVHFALIDGLVSAHGNGAAWAPSALNTNVLLGSGDPLLCDIVAAAKMGVDPLSSPLTKGVCEAVGFPSRYEVVGNLAPYRDWRNVHPALLESVRARDAWVGADRAITPWLHSVNTQLFPFKNALDERLNRFIAPLVSQLDRDEGARMLLAAGNFLLAWIYQALFAYRVQFDKDALSRLHMPINIEVEKLAAGEFDAVADEARSWMVLLGSGNPNHGACDLAWRYLDRSVLFEVSHTVPVEFEEFSSRFDIARSIEFMNDYIGGDRRVVERDAQGRPLRQVERNLYLPQPNYLSAYGGQTIDVTKLEIMEYDPDAQRMWWKTVFSENGSAARDDGMVSIARDAAGSTRLSVCARQLFSLPPLIDALRLDLVPELKNALVTSAYEVFAQRTFANFVAVTEGRDPRIGKDWALPDSVEDRLVDLLSKELDRARAGEGSFGWVVKLLERPKEAGAATFVDAQGFSHFRPAPAPADKAAPGQVASFWRGLSAAIAKDVRA